MVDLVGIPHEDDDTSVSSAQALCEMLGIQSLDVELNEDQDTAEDSTSSNQPFLCQSLDDLVRVDETFITRILAREEIQKKFIETSVCVFPNELNVPSNIMRRLTDELVWGGDDKVGADRTNETIHVWKNGGMLNRSVLTRLEHITAGHLGWNQLCNGYIRRCVSLLMGQEMVLFKTKLNLKPAGGSGFAPHVDTPSLKIALGDDGPQTFVTVMVAIDPMTLSNGCLSVVEGAWNETNACLTIAPDAGASPDAGGRAGAILPEVADTFDFMDVACDGGSIIAFNGWTPHRSGSNQSNFARRAVFLTYNPASEGDCHDAYYERMARLRQQWRSTLGNQYKPGASNSTGSTVVDAMELIALATIPRT